MTYGRNSANDIVHERAAYLTYSDFQKFIKVLRRHGYNVRYFVAGEYGKRKGRAHWHPVLYFKGKVPDWKLDRNIEIPEWPHGYTFWTKPSHHALRYNCKYIQKAMGSEQLQGKLMMSKKPPLGAAYFEELAEKYVAQGLAPQDLSYSFPEVTVRKRSGEVKPYRFMMKGRTAELFLSHYLEAWRARHGKRPWPNSELVDLFDEYGRVVNDEQAVADEATKHVTTRKLVADYWKPQPDELDALRLHQEWWTAYWERWPDGEERQKQRDADDVQYWSEWCDAYDRTLKAGAVHPEDRQSLRREVGQLLADLHASGLDGLRDERISPYIECQATQQWDEEIPWDHLRDAPFGKADNADEPDA